MTLYWRLWFGADGTAEYGQAIRWAYLWGLLGKDPKATKKVERLDRRNFKKWKKKKQDNNSFTEYLKVASV